MRLELNAPALERLLGGDTEIEVHLRQQIVEEFGKKYLKSLINDATTKAVFAEWNKEIKSAVDEAIAELKENKQTKIGHIVDDMSYGYIWDLKSAIEKSAKEQIHSQIELLVEKQKAYYTREVNEQIKMAISKEVAKQVEKGIRERLEVAKTIKV